MPRQPKGPSGPDLDRDADGQDVPRRDAPRVTLLTPGWMLLLAVAVVVVGMRGRAAGAGADGAGDPRRPRRPDPGPRLHARRPDARRRLGRRRPHDLGRPLGPPPGRRPGARPLAPHGPGRRRLGLRRLRPRRGRDDLGRRLGPGPGHAPAGFRPRSGRWPSATTAGRSPWPTTRGSPSPTSRRAGHGRCSTGPR